MRMSHSKRSCDSTLVNKRWNSCAFRLERLSCSWFMVSVRMPSANRRATSHSTSTGRKPYGSFVKMPSSVFSEVVTVLDRELRSIRVRTSSKARLLPVPSPPSRICPASANSLPISCSETDLSMSVRWLNRRSTCCFRASFKRVSKSREPPDSLEPYT